MLSLRRTLPTTARTAKQIRFDVGADAVARYFAVVEDCAAADKLRVTDK